MGFIQPQHFINSLHILIEECDHFINIHFPLIYVSCPAFHAMVLFVVKTSQPALKKQRPNREKTLLLSYSPTFTDDRKISHGRNWKLSYISWFDAYLSSLSTSSLRSFRSLQFAPFPTRPLLESKSGFIPVFFLIDPFKVRYSPCLAFYRYSISKLWCEAHTTPSPRCISA